MFQPASSAELVREGHWIAQISALGMAALMLLILYLTIRYLLTSSARIETAPAHIQNAIPFLKWTAVTTLLIATIGGGVDAYTYIFQLGFSGSLSIEGFASLFAEIMIFAVLGSTVALTAFLGIALIFFKKSRHEKQTHREQKSVSD